MFFEKDPIVAPLHTLKVGASFIFPYSGKDTTFEVIKKRKDEVIAKNLNTSEEMTLSAREWVYTEKNEILDNRHTTFDSLDDHQAFSHGTSSYVKINSQEAVNLTPTVNYKRNLMSLVKLNSELRVLTKEEAISLNFIPAWTTALTQENLNNLDDRNDLALWYPVEKFTNKTVVNLDWVPTKQ